MDDASASTALGGQKYEASNDIANAWIQQQFLRRQASMGSSSVPHNVTFPSMDGTEETFPETIDTLPTEASTECNSATLLPSSISKPILLRLASQNAYEGEGIEATELADDAVVVNEEEDDDDDDEWSSHRRDSQSRQIPIMVPMDASIRTCNSWDTGMSSYYSQFYHQHHPLSQHQQQQQQGNYNEIFRNPIVRSLSHDDQMAGKFYLGTGGTYPIVYTLIVSASRLTWR